MRLLDRGKELSRDFVAREVTSDRESKRRGGQ